MQKRLQRIEQRETATDVVIITSAAVFLDSMKYPDQSVHPNVRKHISRDYEEKSVNKNLL